ncbi:hypothetical protein GOP47_0027752 [Adiantum capillus-veneris]|nr:hypothetical protein GOP47_0027752 [Adiantum capillus-veneris]
MVKKRKILQAVSRSGSSRTFARRGDLLSTLDQATTSLQGSSPDHEAEVSPEKHADTIDVVMEEIPNPNQVVGVVVGTKDGSGDQDEFAEEAQELVAASVAGPDHADDDGQSESVSTQTTTLDPATIGKKKIEIYGKILENSTPQAFLERVKVKHVQPPPMVPLRRMLPTEAIRKISPLTKRTVSRSFKKMGGYIPSKGAFTVNIYDLEGE